VDLDPLVGETAHVVRERVPRRSWRLNRAKDASSNHDAAAGSKSKKSSTLAAIEPITAISFSFEGSPSSLNAM
jgi:hypothetical protein